jgi:hypothetical protein
VRYSWFQQAQDTIQCSLSYEHTVMNLRVQLKAEGLCRNEQLSAPNVSVRWVCTRAPRIWAPASGSEPNKWEMYIRLGSVIRASYFIERWT